MTNKIIVLTVAEKYMLPIIVDEVYEYAVSMQYVILKIIPVSLFRSLLGKT